MKIVDLKDIDTGLLTQCYVSGVKCKDRFKIKVLKGELKDSFVFICHGGCSKEENNCPFLNNQSKS